MSDMDETHKCYKCYQDSSEAPYWLESDTQAVYTQNIKPEMEITWDALSTITHKLTPSSETGICLTQYSLGETLESKQTSNLFSWKANHN